MAAAKKKGGKKGLMIGVILLVLVISVGAAIGLAMTGKINIPGLTPKKKPIPAAVPTEKKKLPVDSTKKEPEPEKAPAPTNTKQGAAKVAEVWNEMQTADLAKLIEKWKPTELAIVLNEMDAAKVASVLALMKPERASNVSLEMQKIAAQIPAE